MPEHGQSVAMFVSIALVSFLLGVLFAWLWRSFRGIVLLATAAFWMGYALWELLVQWRTPGADIRFDLVVIYPLLLIATTIAMLALWRRARKGP